MKKNMVLCILFLFVFSAGIASAGESWLLTIDNRTGGDITLVPGDLRCWRTRDFDTNPIQKPGRATYFMEKKIAGCVLKDQIVAFTITTDGSTRNDVFRMGYNPLPFVECPGLACTVRSHSGSGWSTGAIEVTVTVR